MCFVIASAILPNLNAVELSTFCKNVNTDGCKITTPQTTITNHSNFVVGGGEAIVISSTIGIFINYGKISVGSSSQQTFTLKDGNGYIGHFINYGTFGNLDKMGIWVNNDKGMSKVTNYGEMGSINYNNATTPLTLNNLGLMGAKGDHIQVKSSKVFIQNYTLRISETASTFNNFTNDYNKDNFSHLIIKTESGGSVAFKDSDSKMILDFGNGFEFGEKYLISKIATDGSGKAVLGADFSRLTTRSDIYYLTQSGESFIVHLAPQYGAVGGLYKANIRTMNNFYIISNSMIYPRKYSKSQNLRKSSLRVSEANVAIQDLNTNETFFYQNESQNLQTRRIKRTNKRNYSRNLSNSQNLNTDSANRTRERKNQRNSQNLAQNDKYYFILTPFINHNYFFESGRYNLSGFDYGFLTAFNAQVAESNSLGAHFAFSYGSLGDSHDKDLSIKSMNFMLGVNYKLDLVYDMFLKARGDVFYFLNALDSATLKNIKPNNLGFGASIAYGKDFDFKQGGILGIEGGLDYKALSASEITLDSMSETYKKSLYNVLYVDLGISYAKYFGNFGLNANLGIKGNITANKLAKSQIILKNFNRSVDMILDNDKILGYANVGLSYVLNARNFDMEFSLAYYGNFGDRILSNGGGVEWRVTW